MEATEAVLDAILEGGKTCIKEAIFQLPPSETKTRLEQCLATFLDASEKYLEAGASMEIESMARGLARGGIVNARHRWISRREAIARQLGEWANGIRDAQAAYEERVHKNS